ncbi:putative xyloglucan endotransglucosylase/hydrolase protein-like [Capsicum annuum]|nr:putative xyloglucan endotransglucosylase/hydrolase protein-like [Capsicum annuum]
MSSKTSNLMTRRKDKKDDDGIMRQLAASMAWKSLDEHYPSFVVEPHNVILRLASDGFQACLEGSIAEGNIANKCMALCTREFAQTHKDTIRHLSDVEWNQQFIKWLKDTDKFEGVELSDHGEHILRWINELWNKWTGYLYGNYDQIEEILNAEPFLSSIEIVEKCFRPQNHSHVVAFGGGVKEKDLQSGTFSKAKLLSMLRSTREENKYLNEENKSLHDRLSTLKDEMKEIRKMKEFFASQQPRVRAATLPFSTE